MNPWLLVAVGFFLAFVVGVLPRMRDRYEERYNDEREFFREQRPRMWGLIEGVADSDDATDQDLGRCPVCGVENDPQYTYCHNCDSRLPTADE